MFGRVKEEHSGLTLSQETIKKTSVGVTRNIVGYKIAVAFKW